MAEATSLAIGVAGLAGLFSSCLQAFSLFHASRAYGRDCEVLLTKLDVEKTLLLQWGNRVGLLTTCNTNDGNDWRNQQHICSAIERILKCVILLLTDSEKLRSEYGAIPDSLAVGTLEDTVALSSGRMSSFINSYREFQARIGIRQDNASLLQKTRWAIRDRDKFSSLISELGCFIRFLNELVPASEQVRQLFIKEDIERLTQDMRTLHLIQEACATDHRDWSEAASIRMEATQLGTEDLQRIEDWIPDVEDGPQEEALNPTSSLSPNEPSSFDPDMFRSIATGSLDSLVQMCKSGTMLVTATDTNGHSLLRVS